MRGILELVLIFYIITYRATGNAVNECPDLRSGHWHHSASSNLFYVQCVYIEFGGGLKMVARSKGPIEFGEFAFIVLVKVWLDIHQICLYYYYMGLYLLIKKNMGLYLSLQ